MAHVGAESGVGVISRIWCAVAALLCATLMIGSAFSQNIGPVAGQGPGNVGAPFTVTNGHFSLGNIASPTPNAACGAGAAAVGNDSAFRLVSGTSTNAGCQLKFATPWQQVPICSLDNQTSAGQATFNVSVSGINLLGVADSQTYNVLCIGQAGG